MAGNRRRTGRAKAREARLTNRRRARTKHLARLAAADTASERIWVAANYLRSALRAAPTEQAEQIVDQLVSDLIAAADALLTPKPTRRTR